MSLVRVIYIPLYLKAMVRLTKCTHQNLFSLAVNKLDKTILFYIVARRNWDKIRSAIAGTTKIVLNWLILMSTTDVLRESFIKWLMLMWSLM